MAKEEKPIPYERRILDTKGLAQRLDLNYLRRRHWFRTSRRRLAFLLPLLALAAVTPFVLGVGASKVALTSGPMTRAHRIIEKECQNCHAGSFTSVKDQDCKACHDGPVHHPNQLFSPRCADCHVEHRGTYLLSEVADANCTRCHADLNRAGVNLRLPSDAMSVRKFAQGRHPPFTAENRRDERPIKLNHFVHLPEKGKIIRGMTLPMKCVDCHQFAPRDSALDLVPVTFVKDCASCHARELEFDIFGALGAGQKPAPHTKEDLPALRDFVYGAYRKALERDPNLWRKPLKEFQPAAPSPAAWVETTASQSLAFILDKKCVYCHEIEGRSGNYPVIRRVNHITGQYIKDRVEGIPWFAHAEFSHRTHRMLDCNSCHPQAKASTKTSDVLIPKMANCLPCHGSSGTALDNCAQCHLYHDKTREEDQARRTMQQVFENLRPARRTPIEMLRSVLTKK
jgi:hypothetical protein